MFSRLISLYRRRLSVRLTVNYTVVLLCLFVLAGGFFLHRLNENLSKQIDRLLYDEARELIQELGATENPLQACSLHAETVARRLYYPIYFRISDAQGHELCAIDAVVREKTGTRLRYPPLQSGDRMYYTFSVPDRSPFRCYQRRMYLNDADVYILQIITPTSLARRTMQEMVSKMLLALPVVLVLSLLVGLSASRRPFIIMRRMNAVTRRITAENLRERLPVPDTESEVRELTDTINDMLGRLEAAFSEVRQFTADVAHELRNPLCAVQGQMEVLLSRERSATEYRDVIAETLVRISVLIKIVNDLFLISRFDNHKVLLEKEDIDLVELLRDLYDFFEPVAREKQIVFTFKSCPPMRAAVDRTHMQQLVSNLIDNALKFTPAGQSVILELEALPGALELRVTDTGIGIAPEDLPYIFKRFYQADKARSGMERGSGLGLQICKRIAEAHGGEITVDVNASRGLTAILRLPR